MEYTDIVERIRIQDPLISWLRETPFSPNATQRAWWNIKEYLKQMVIEKERKKKAKVSILCQTK